MNILTRTRSFLTMALAVVALVFVSACADTATETPEPAPESTEEAAPANTIANIAAGNEDFSTLVAALQAAELVETLNGEGPFTVFAPTNDAFAALPEGTVESLLQPENKDQLTNILTYHVASGNVMAADVVGMENVETLQGGMLDVTVDGETVMIGNATVVTTDIEADNGVIHVIDTVLIPEADDSSM